ncbi:MAG: hypothetical protein EGR29_00330 [Faecalibacterium prausnitzii]|nr:hypothetical protein [Faecalibacterium prausnitzii]
MMHLNPLVLVGAVIGVITALLVAAYAAVKDKKTAMGFERNMEDGEIMRRLARYARPYLSKFLIVGLLMLFSIAYDIISPLIVGRIEELVAGEFELRALFLGVSVYAGVLVFSMGSTYLQAVILQRVGQRIISDLREDLFSHIESLAHEQLNEIPVGKLVTRVTNDTNAISMMFTNLLVQLTKNSFVILGILVAMLCLNYELTLMVLCFVPFIVIFTVIFRKFSRRANRKLKNATTDINTYLSENLSGIKVTQIFGREDEKMEDFRQKSQKLARANQEQNDDAARPAIAGQVADMVQYDTVFVGFPIWWYQAPRIIETFLESYDFSGKTVIPFATSGGSGMGGEDILKAACSKDTKWLPGKRLSSRESAASVQKWVESLGL